MRRASDSQVFLFHLRVAPLVPSNVMFCRWVNATQILKVAGVHKSARTKILEKEVLNGIHEKIQGGCAYNFIRSR